MPEISSQQQRPETSSSSASSLRAAERTNEKSEETATAPSPRAPSPAAPAAPADAEAQLAASHRSHFATVFDQAGVTDAVRNYKYRGSGTGEDPYVVDFLSGGDAHNAMGYSDTKKWLITIFLAGATLAVAFVSTAYTGGVSYLRDEFHVSNEVVILGISLFVVGFAVGPLLWAPLSEMYGRQKILFVSYTGLTAFCAGATGARNMRTLLVLRFFAGAFGSSPLTNSGGVLADMFAGSQRGLAMAVFAMAPFLGPAIGPIAGGFLGAAGGWRWVEGLMAAFTGLIWLIGAFFVPETYAPVLLRRRAAALSRLTGKVYVSKLDVGKPAKTIVQEFKVALLRPWILLFREPIVTLTALYMAIIYGTLYMLFDAFPIVFEVQRNWGLGISGLAFVGVAVGILFAIAYSVYDNRRYQAILATNNGLAAPEDRLPPAIVGSVLLPIGLFWFAWTDGINVHWVVPIIASGFFAAGLCTVFLSLINYLIDSYVVFAASVLAANTVLRSLFGAAFPLFTTQMYDNLGIHWAGSIPAFLALACLPLPPLFYKYGEQIRLKCKFAAEAAEILDVMRKQLQPSISVPDEDEAMARVEEQDRLAKAEKVRSRDSRAAAEGLAEVTELVRVNTMREREEREREQMKLKEEDAA